MTRRADPFRVGLFSLLGIALLTALVISVTGGRIFSLSEKAVLNFPGSVWGLQIGAPVVLRGVRIGSVTAVTLTQDATTGALSAPVVIEIDRRRIRDAHGGSADDGAALPQLVQRGLRARLAAQSLLTGRLFVEMDLEGAPRAAAAVATVSGAVQIPTVATSSMQALQQQLEGVNLRQLVQDISATADAARRLMSSPELAKSIEQIAVLTTSLARASAVIDQRIGPLADGAQSTLADTRKAIAQLGTAAERLANASERVGGAAANAEKLLAADSPLVASVRLAVDDIGRSATALRAATADDSAVMQNLDGTLAELRRTSRSVRSLAELLERRPDALLRGKGE